VSVRKSNDNASDANTSNVMVYYALPQPAALAQGGKNRNFVHVCRSWWHFTGTSNCRHRIFTCSQLSIWWYLKKFLLEFTNAFQLQVLVLLFLHKTTSWKHHHICFIQVYQTNTVQTSLRDHFLVAASSVKGGSTLVTLPRNVTS